jgi:Flp pilus assembly protein TadG
MGFIAKSKQGLRDESGQALVLMVFSMTVLLGFLALAVDVGLLFNAKRKVQTAADAAAIAGALAYSYQGASYATGAAYEAANSNGVETSAVTVTPSPSDGWHTGAGYIEVVIRQKNPTFLMKVFNRSSMFVAARAVAGITPNPDCIVALDKIDPQSFDVQGNAKVVSPGCSIHINSSSGTALCTTGNATITAPAINIAGAQNPAPPCNGSQNNANTGAQQVADPFTGLEYPTCNAGNTTSVTLVTTSNVASLPSVSATLNGKTAKVTCFSGSNVSIASGVTLGKAGDSQIFVFQNGLKEPNGNGSITVNGTIDLAGGGFDQKNFGIKLTAPADSTAAYNGLGFIVPATNTSVTCSPPYGGTQPCVQIQFGSGGGDLDGIMYVPGATLFMQDDGGGNQVAGIVAYKLYDKSSNLIITKSYNVAHASTTPLSTIALVE